MRSLAKLAIVALVLCGAAVALTMPLPQPIRLTRLSGVMDAGHFFLFAGVTLCFAWALGRRRWLALLLTVAAIALLEAAQVFFGRSANLRDLLLGLFGALAAFAVLESARRPIRFKRVLLYGMAGAGMTVWPVMLATPHLWDAWNEYRSFPVLCDFQSRWQTLRWTVGRSYVQRVATHRSQQDRAGRISVPGNGRSSLLVLVPMNCDWTDYGYLCCEFSVVEHPVPVSIKLRTGHAKPTRTGTLVRSSFPPGRHHIRLKLGPRDGEPAEKALHLSEIHSLYVGIGDGQDAATILIHKIYLAEPAERPSALGGLSHVRNAVVSVGSGHP